MAMSANGSAVNVGNSGRIRVIINVLSQSQSNNTSQVRVRGQMSKRNNTTAYNNNGVPMRIYGNHGITSRSSSTPFSVSGTSWKTFRDETYTVTHASDGRRTVTAYYELGATGTSSFGNGGTAKVTLSINRIPKAPSKPGKPSVSSATSSSFKASVSAPASNGASITQYQWQVGNDTFTSSGRSITITGRTANASHRVRVRARNSVGWSSWSSWSNYISTKPNSPAAPTNVTASRVSDTNQYITWTRNATSSAPYTSQRVQRNHWTGSGRSAWVTIATVSSTATSYNDTSTSKYNDYRYRVQAVNSTGTGTSAQSNKIRTTPAPPIDVSAQKLSGSNDIQVDFTQVMYPDSGNHNEIQDNPGGTGWVTIGTTENESTFTHIDPNPAVTHQYRVRTVDTENGVLNGEWSIASNVVQLLAPPLAPTLLEPTGIVDRDEDTRFEWRHNSVDTTDQTEFELEWDYTDSSAPSPWRHTGTTDEFLVLPAFGVSDEIQWRVRTKGDFPEFGPWSPWKVFSTVSRPEATISEPGNSLNTSQVEVIWTYQSADPSGQAGWEAELLDDGENNLERASGSGTTSEHLFDTILDNATEYTVQVRVRSGTGLWSEWDTSTFTTDFPLPTAVEVLPVKNDEDASVTLTFQEDEWAQYSWEGEPNDSPSVRVTGEGSVTNVVLNPNMVASTEEVTVFANYAQNPSSEEEAMTPVSTEGFSITRASGGGGAKFGNWYSVLTATEEISSMGIRDSGVPGNSEFGSYILTASMWVRLPTQGARMNAKFRLSHGIRSKVIPNPGGAGFPSGWFEVSGNVQLQSTTTKYDVLFEILLDEVDPEDYVNLDVWFDGFHIIQGALPPDGYFDKDVAEEYAGDPDLTMGDLPDGGVRLYGYAVEGMAEFFPGGVLIASSQWAKSGSTSLRVINTSGKAYFIYAVANSDLVTGSVWRYLEAPLTLNDDETLPSEGAIFGVSVDGYTFPEEMPPNNPGEHSMRISRDTEDPEWQIVGLSGPSEFGESVWFDVLTATEEPYDGPPFSGNSTSTIATEWIDVQRNDGDGWITIARDVDPETSLVDYIPALNEDVRYRAISRTSLPTARLGPETSVDMTYDCDQIFVNGDNNFSLVAVAPGNALARSPKVESDLHRWAGWEYPQAVFGVGEEYGVTFTAPLIDTNRGFVSTREEGWVELLRTRRILAYRDTSGRKFFGIMGVNFSQQEMIDNLSLKMERAHFIEGVEPEFLPEDLED